MRMAFLVFALLLSLLGAFCAVKGMQSYIEANKASNSYGAGELRDEGQHWGEGATACIIGAFIVSRLGRKPDASK